MVGTMEDNIITSQGDDGQNSLKVPTIFRSGLGRRRVASILGVLILTLGLAGGLLGLKNEQDKRSRASGENEANLTLVSTKSNVEIGEEFDVNVLINAKENKVSAAEVHILFDPQYFEGKSITKGTFLPVVIRDGVIEGGEAKIILGSEPDEPKKRAGTLVRLRLKALAEVSSSEIKFDALKTQVSAVGLTENIVGKLENTTVSISLTGASPSPSPSSSPTPSPLACQLKPISESFDASAPNPEVWNLVTEKGTKIEIKDGNLIQTIPASKEKSIASLIKTKDNILGDFVAEVTLLSLNTDLKEDNENATFELSANSTGKTLRLRRIKRGDGLSKVDFKWGEEIGPASEFKVGVNAKIKLKIQRVGGDLKGFVDINDKGYELVHTFRNAYKGDFEFVSFSTRNDPQIVNTKPVAAAIDDFVLRCPKGGVKVGDVNGDKKVDVIDAQLVSENFSLAPIPDDKKRLDLNSDGKVDIIDLGLVTDNFD